MDNDKSRVAPVQNPLVEGLVPPVMMVAPAGNVDVEDVVSPAMAAAPAENVQGVVPPEMMAAPVGDVPVVDVVPISVVPAAVTPGTGGEIVPWTGGADEVDTSGRKKRGRPSMYDDQGNLNGASDAESSNLQSPTRSQFGEEGRLPLSLVRWGFTPHLIMAEIGEDVAVKVATFLVHNGSKGICILSASGTVSKVSIRQIGVSGASQTYEGLFQIMALSGSFTPADSGIRRGRAGGLSVALAGADGQIIGGIIAGTLVAASPIKVVLGTFESGDWQNRKGRSPLQESASATLSAPGPNQAEPAPAPPVNPGANVVLKKDLESGKSDDSHQ